MTYAKKSRIFVIFSITKMGLKFLFNPFGTFVEYSWGIRGVFVEYSWDIRMYRVCVGYVSGMYRESVEGYGEGRRRGGGEYIYSSDKKY